MDDNSSINRYFLEIQNCFENISVLKFLNFQKPLNLLMKICNGHIFFEKIYFFKVSILKNKDQFRRIRTVVTHCQSQKKHKNPSHIGTLRKEFK